MNRTEENDPILKQQSKPFRNFFVKYKTRITLASLGALFLLALCDPWTAELVGDEHELVSLVGLALIVPIMISLGLSLNAFFKHFLKTHSMPEGGWAHALVSIGMGAFGVLLLIPDQESPFFLFLAMVGVCFGFLGAMNLAFCLSPFIPPFCWLEKLQQCPSCGTYRRPIVIDNLYHCEQCGYIYGLDGPVQRNS